MAAFSAGAPLAGLDLIRLGKTIQYLLRNAEGTGLEADADGWFRVDDVARVVSRTIRKPVASADVAGASICLDGGRMQVTGGRIRASVGGGPSSDRFSGPDLLFHSSPQARVHEYLAEGALFAPGRGGVRLSRLESAAWRVGHRSFVEPVVLVVDAARARRDRITFTRVRAGLYTTPTVPICHVLNLRDGFAEQASAGGFVVEWTSGAPRIALIRVARRNGATWEVAKGKLEAGESPLQAARREMREEMGIDLPVEHALPLGAVRYGFYTRDGTPRLKTIHVYVLEVAEAFANFRPATSEGIEEVRWFDLAEAISVLAHPSLRGTIGRLVAALDERARELGLAPVRLGGGRGEEE